MWLLLSEEKRREAKCDPHCTFYQKDFVPRLLRHLLKKSYQPFKTQYSVLNTLTSCSDLHILKLLANSVHLVPPSL